ncbi:MAG: type II toxin-antitoxin system VapC family toxin [Solirubrobacterales bacterium]
MILDSSAVVSVLREEVGHKRLHGALERADALAIGAPTLFETGMVAIGRFGEHGRALVAQFLEYWDVEVAPFDGRHWRVATDAFVRYGKGRHPAALNYGDCMTYATARLADLPLLFTGDDFAQTDLAAA